MDTAMDTVIYKHSILNKDGHNIIVDLYTWATSTLSGAALSRFLSDWSEYMVYLDEKILQNIIFIFVYLLNVPVRFSPASPPVRSDYFF